MEFSQKKEEFNDEYRKRFIRLVVAQDNEVEEGIDDTRESVESLVAKNSGSEIKDESKISSGFSAIMAVWASSYLSTLIKFNSQTAGLVGEQQRVLIAEEYNNADFDRLIGATAENLEEDVRKTIPYRSFPTDGVTVGDRIKTVQGEALKTLRDILTVGIKEGKSAKQIASDLDNFLKPSDDKSWVGPFDWFRKRFGYKVNKVPAGKPAGSVYFNSIRIARTEINHTYRQSTVILHKDKPWVKGYIWNLSPSHPQRDICDDWAADSPYKDEREVLALGHPYCMCYITVDLFPPNELIEDTIEEWEDKIRNEKIENAYMFDKNGKLLYKAKGNENSVDFTSDEWSNARGNIVTHNHPIDIAFSEEDIQQALLCQLKEMRAVTKTKVHIARFPEKFWKDKTTRTRMLVYEKRDKLYDSYKENIVPVLEKIDPEGLKPSDYVKIDNAWKKISKDVGFEYIVKEKK